MNSDLFWYDDPSIIWKKERLTEFFPIHDQTLEERFNAIVRLSLYCSVILFYYHKNYKYLGIFIGTLLITYFVYVNRPIESKQIQDTKIPKSKGIQGTKIESLENDQVSMDKCTVPTLDNPFMNVTMKDMMNVDPKTQKMIDRPPACDISNPLVKRQMDNMFNNNLFRDTNDLFGKFNSQRQFYTMPSTTIPNAQDEFAKWLYLNPKTCKEDQNFCLQYEDVRAKRPVMYNPNQNPVDTKKNQ